MLGDGAHDVVFSYGGHGGLQLWWSWWSSAMVVISSYGGHIELWWSYRAMVVMVVISSYGGHIYGGHIYGGHIYMVVISSSNPCDDSLCVVYLSRKIESNLKIDVQMTPIMAGITTITVTLVIILFSKSSGGVHTADHGATTDRETDTVATLTRTAVQWSVTPDHSSTLLKLLHATYASAFLSAAKTIVGDDTRLHRISGVDVLRLYTEMTLRQQQALGHIQAVAPDVMPRLVQ